MHSHRFRVGLSFIVGLGCWFGKVQAQVPVLAPLPAPNIVTAPNNDNDPPRATGPVSGVQAQPQAGANGRKGDWLLRHGYTCGQNLHWYGCGGWHAQNQFAFGSCRTFFGEPCLPRQPNQHGGGCPGGCTK